jgi:hypothetical protein
MSVYPRGRTVQTQWSWSPFSSYISSRKELIQGNVPAVEPSGNAVEPAVSLSLSLQLNFTGEVTIAYIF